MGKVRAAGGSLAFLVLAPGTVVGLLPWLITGWHGHSGLAAEIAGGLLTAAGCGVLLQAFGQFVLEGIGTPAPPAPTERLVVRGLYRYVRNPMYLAVLAGITGQAILLARPVLIGYAATVAVAFASFVHFYEEPVLARRYGEEYREYRGRVPGWLPARPGRRATAADGDQAGSGQSPSRQSPL